jgi:hypothetical protein
MCISMLSLSYGVFQVIANARIREAMEKGEFDNLEGKGKPLKNLGTMVEGGEMDLAHKIMKNAGIVPDWIVNGKNVREEIDCFRESLKSNPPSRAQAVLKVEMINKKIRHFNLGVPISSQQMALLDVDRELSLSVKKK